MSDPSSPAKLSEAAVDPLVAIYRQLLVEIGEDPEREGLRETPGRAARAFRDFTRGYAQNVETGDEFVFVVGQEFYPATGLCGIGEAGKDAEVTGDDQSRPVRIDLSYVSRSGAERNQGDEEWSESHWTLSVDAEKQPGLSQ